MDISVIQGNIAEQATDCIVVNLFENVTEPSGATDAVDKALNGAIRRLIASGDFTGKSGSTSLLYPGEALPAGRVLLVGLGDPAKFDLHAARKAAATAYKALAKLSGVKRAATVVHGAGAAGLDAAAAGQALAEGTLLAEYQAPNYKREAPERNLAALTVVEFDGAKLAEIEAGVRRGEAIAHGVITARDLSNEPPNVLVPVEFASRAAIMSANSGLHLTVLGEDADGRAQHEHPAGRQPRQRQRGAADRARTRT